MSDTLATLRRKLDGAQKLESVVRAMKAVAASSITQYEAAVRALGDYQHSVELGLCACLRDSAVAARGQPDRSDGHPIGAIVFGSDQGLVGRFNEVIAEFVLRRLAALPGPKKIWVIGERLCSYFTDAGLTVAGQFAVPSSVMAITPLVGQIQIVSEANHSNGEYAEIHVFHNRRQTTVLYQPVSERLLPLDALWQQRFATLRWPTASLPDILGCRDITLGALVREYLFISLYRACAESLTSENGSRLAAMQRAEENIETLSSELSRSFHRLRQGSIDDELFDVIAGFNALTKATGHTSRQLERETPPEATREGVTS